MINKKFMLFQCCIPVKGINKGVIIDFQRKSMYVVSNQIIDILNQYKHTSILDLFRDFRVDRDILKKHVRFFIKNELVIITEDTTTFPEVDLIYERPNQLEILTIEIVEFDIIKKIFYNNELDNLGIKSLRLIIRQNTSSTLEQILECLKDSKIQSIYLFTEYNSSLESSLKKTIKQNPRLRSVIFFDCNNKIRKKREDNIFYDSLPLKEALNKGVQGPNNFSFNFHIYLESLKHNISFNKTIFIDSLGNIKRYFSDYLECGNIINENAIENALKNQELREFWNITKDKIEVCKDCEFRFICTDTRIPYKMKDKNVYSYFETCNYDPYLNKWINQN